MQPHRSDNYLLACARYIDLNPVRAHIVEQPEDYPWSSYGTRAGLSDSSWLDPDPCFLALAPTTEQQQLRYREFVSRFARHLRAATFLLKPSTCCCSESIVVACVQTNVANCAVLTSGGVVDERVAARCDIAAVYRMHLPMHRCLRRRYQLESFTLACRFNALQQQL